jgi:indolepyruvate ferredoxin oxidoreductase
VAIRLADLVGYQGERLARRYLDRVLAVADAEAERLGPRRTEVTGAVASGLHKLMAYKDEYEVARLYLRRSWRAQVAAEFEAPVRVSYNFHPPASRWLRADRKLELGPWFTPVLWALRCGRRLRGSPLDPFGWQAARRRERALIGWYTGLVDQGLARLRPLTAGTVLRIAQLPDLIRGYEQVKAAGEAQARAAAQELLAELDRPPLPLTVTRR